MEPTTRTMWSSWESRTILAFIWIAPVLLVALQFGLRVIDWMTHFNKPVELGIETLPLLLALAFGFSLMPAAATGAVYVWFLKTVPDLRLRKWSRAALAGVLGSLGAAVVVYATGSKGESHSDIAKLIGVFSTYGALAGGLIAFGYPTDAMLES